MEFLKFNDMKGTALKFILAVLILLLAIPAVKPQEIKSEKVKVLVNTSGQPEAATVKEAGKSEKSKEPAASPVKQEVKKPDVLLLEPRTMKQGETFMPDLQVITLVMKIVNPAAGIKVMVNNVEVEPTAAGDLYTYTYQLMKGSNSLYISLLQDGKEIKDLAYSIFYTDPVKNLSPFALPEGKYYALIIANDTYKPESGMMNLQRPVRDATALREVLTSRYTFDRNNVITLYNRSKLDVEVQLEELQKRLLPEDNLLIFYAGHGIMDQEADIGYWLLSDATKSRVTWLRNSTITDFIKACRARHILLIADACYSGTIFTSRGYLDNAPPAITDLMRSKSRKAITSGGTTEVADESKFAQVLIEQLKLNTEQYLTSLQLYNLIQRQVLANSLTSPRWGPISNVGDDNGDFVFILRQKE